LSVLLLFSVPLARWLAPCRLGGGGLYAPVGEGPRRTTYKPPGLSLDPYKHKSHKYFTTRIE